MDFIIMAAKLNHQEVPTAHPKFFELIVPSLGLKEMGRLQKFNLICLVLVSRSVASITFIKLWLLNQFPDFSFFPDPESTDEEKARSPLRRSPCYPFKMCTVNLPFTFS